MCVHVMEIVEIVVLSIWSEQGRAQLSKQGCLVVKVLLGRVDGIDLSSSNAIY